MGGCVLCTGPPLISARCRALVYRISSPAGEDATPFPPPAVREAKKSFNLKIGPRPRKFSARAKRNGKRLGGSALFECFPDRQHLLGLDGIRQDARAHQEARMPAANGQDLPDFGPDGLDRLRRQEAGADIRPEEDRFILELADEKIEVGAECAEDVVLSLCH